MDVTGHRSEEQMRKDYFNISKNMRNFEHTWVILISYLLSLEVLAVVTFRHYPGTSNNANVQISGTDNYRDCLQQQ